jgi:mannose-6-phosphate isomerase
MARSNELAQTILKVASTRVWRTYLGGMEIDKWQGLAHAQDGELPEDWIASTVKARNPGREQWTEEGLSKVILDGGETVSLKELIGSDPAGFLGVQHVETYSQEMGVLVKMIDSLSRLTIQVHPDKTFAKDVLGSDYGKTEAWYILGGRRVNGEDPYVLLGFKSGVTREAWENLFYAQDIAGMMDALHKVYVQPGEVYFIEGGVPHAIGSGCFLVEIQEPTDFTLRTERTTPEGRTISDQLCHQGAGFERLFDCFHYDALTKEDMLKKWRIAPQVIHESSEACEHVLIGDHCTTLFNMNKLQIRGAYAQTLRASFSIAIVVSGSGKLAYAQGEVEIKQGEFLFVPAQVHQIQWVADTDFPLEIVMCFPPGVPSEAQ